MLSSTPKVGNRAIFIIAVTVIAVLIVDTALERISDLLGAQSAASDMRVALFIVISGIAYGIGQYLILSFVRYRSKQIIGTTEGRTRKKDDNKASSSFYSRLTLIHRMVSIVQYMLTAILVSVILLILFESYFYTNLLILSTVISYTLSIFLLSLLARRFFSWYRSNRNLVVLSYGLASAILTINLALTVAFMTSILLSKPVEIRTHLTTIWPVFSSDSPMGMLNSAYVISGIISFMLMWVSTTLLLRHHSRKLGKTKYWVIVIIPLVYFLSQFTPLFLNNISAPLMTSDPIFAGILLTLIFAVSKPAGGILFGIAFWAVAKAVRESSVVRDYMIMSALGVVVLFVSGQGSVISATYPPFGLVTVSFVGLSSYMMVIGLYSSAVSVSEDAKLRQTIRKKAIEESKLLDSIGTAQMGQEIERKVMEIERKVMEIAKQDSGNLEIETGVKPSLNEYEMKKYLEEVLQEVNVIMRPK
jgi:hypothetical protein